MKKTLGGDRLGSGKKMKVELKNFERSTFDKSYIWRNTQSPGTLVPFIKEPVLPGDTFDINLDAFVNTHPTVGPLFGSFKLQLDVFLAPIRLYQGQLHNNKLGIGMKMADVKLPTMTLSANPMTAEIKNGADYDNYQINPSCVLSYLGIRGVVHTVQPNITRDFNAVPLLALWDIYKNYYANKQEEIGAVIHKSKLTPFNNISSITAGNTPEGTQVIPRPPAAADPVQILSTTYLQILLNAGQTVFHPEEVKLHTNKGTFILTELFPDWNPDPNGNPLMFFASGYKYSNLGTDLFINLWTNITSDEIPQNQQPKVSFFPLSNIDDMREKILAHAPNSSPFNINSTNLAPYTWVTNADGNYHSKLSTQEGLPIKTYQSDLFNNWLSTEWIDGPNGISEVTKIDTTDGLKIDALILARKVYDMLNQIAVSGGTYDDWIDAIWQHERYIKCESPMYMGGLIKEIVFQEVISNSEATNTDGTQPLGTLAGKGTLSGKHKGGHITIKVDEPSYIIALCSITPRLDYSQGNKWDTGLKTMDDFHKPHLDQIGFQELITEQLAWWTSYCETQGEIQTYSAGKQPAWINYMTNVNEVRGNFAVPVGAKGGAGQMFMVLNRNYQWADNNADNDYPGLPAAQNLEDLTTYIDPVKYNHIFAQTSIDAMNFWVQIGVDMIARRKMSSRVMPNL